MMLAGAGSDEWHHFKTGVVEHNPDGSPRRGSMGLSYGMTINVCDLYETVGRNDAAFRREVIGTPHVRDGTPLSALSAGLLLNFVKWMLTGDTRFVIRKGFDTLWVARRTSGLLVDATHRYALRFTYVIEGPTTEAIQQRADAIMGQVPYAVINM